MALRYSVVSKTKGFGQGAVPGEEFVEFGRDMAESEKAIKYLEDAGYDMFDCDNGTYDAWYWAHPPVYMPENCNLTEVEHIKNFTSSPWSAPVRWTPPRPPRRSPPDVWTPWASPARTWWTPSGSTRSWRTA